MPDDLEMLNSAQQDALKNGNRSFSPLVAEIIARHRSIPKTSYEGKPVVIDWDQAKKMILWGLIAVTIQGHDSSLLVITHTRKAYQTKQPSPDEVFRVTQVIDPMQSFHHQHNRVALTSRPTRSRSERAPG